MKRKNVINFVLDNNPDWSISRYDESEDENTVIFRLRHNKKGWVKTITINQIDN